MHRLRVINECLFEREDKRGVRAAPYSCCVAGSKHVDDGASDKDGELALVGTAQLVAPLGAEGVAA
jgi:hypothetical protein